MRNKKETVYRLFFLYSYHIPSICCINRLTAEIPTQQQKPIRIGLPPDLMSLTMLVLRPIAAIAITIKNLLTVLNGEKKASETPNDVATVVMSDAAMKNRIKNGKIFFILMDAPPACFSLRVRTNARTSVIGIIASVRVSFTTVAVSSVLLL